jgi:hypothetical protein
MKIIKILAVCGVLVSSSGAQAWEVDLLVANTSPKNSSQKYRSIWVERHSESLTLHACEAWLRGCTVFAHFNWTESQREFIAAQIRDYDFAKEFGLSDEAFDLLRLAVDKSEYGRTKLQFDGSLVNLRQLAGKEQTILQVLRSYIPELYGGSVQPLGMDPNWNGEIF